MGEEAAGRRKEVFLKKEFFIGGPPLLPLNLLPLNRVIPNSDNHAFINYDLILHRLAEEGSPYRVQKHFYLAFLSSLLVKRKLLPH